MPPLDNKVLVMGKDKHQLFVSTIQRELVTQLGYVAEILANRQTRPAIFADQIIQALGLGLGAASFLGAAGTAVKEITTMGLTTLVNYQYHRKRMHIGMIWHQHDPDKLEQIGFLAGERLALRYAYFMHEMLSDESVEVVKFARCVVVRMLEYAARARVPLSVDTLLQGAYEGFSGAFIDGLKNTYVKGRGYFANHALTAEGALARAGFAVAELGNRQYYFLTKEEAFAKRTAQLQELQQHREQLEKNLTAELAALDLEPAEKNQQLTTRLMTGANSLMDGMLDKAQQFSETFTNYGHVHFDDELGFKYGYAWVENSVRLHYDFLPYPNVEISPVAVLNNYVHPAIRLAGDEAKRMIADYRTSFPKHPQTFKQFMQDLLSPGHPWAEYFRIICLGDFSGEDYSGLDFTNVDFSGSIFIGCNLEKTRFDQGLLYDCDFSHIKAQESSWNGARLIFSTLQGAHLKGASMRSTIAKYSDFTDADLTAISYVGALWLGSDLTGIKYDSSLALLEHLQREQDLQAQVAKENYAKLMAIEDEVDAIREELGEKISRNELNEALTEQRDPLTAEQKTDFVAQELIRLRAHYQHPKQRFVNSLFGPSFDIAKSYINLQMIETVLESTPNPDEEKKQIQKAVLIEDLLKPTEKNSSEEKGTVNKTLWLIEGPPGSGKTVMTHYLPYRWGNKTLWPEVECLLKIPLRNLNSDRYRQRGEPYRLQDVLRMECFPHLWGSEFKILWDAWTKLPPEKKVLILDGHDEISKIISTVSHPLHQCLQELTTQSTWTVIITSRPYGIDTLLPLEPNRVKILGFTDEDIERYIQHYFIRTQQPERAAMCLARVNQSPQLMMAAQTPVYLNIICGVYEENAQALNEMQQSLTDIYYQMQLRVLERSYDKTFEIQNLGKDSKNLKITYLSAADKKQFLHEHYLPVLQVIAHMAWHGLQQEKLILPLTLLENALTATVKAQPNYASLSHLQQLQYKQQWREEFEQLGLMNVLYEDNKLFGYEPLHLTYLEFAAAGYVVQQLLLNSSLMQDFIALHKYDPRYQEVWGFVSGLIRNNTSLLERWVTWLQQPPYDAIGLTELALWIRVLNEIGICVLPKAQLIENKMKQFFLSWLQFYLHSKNSNFLLKEVETNILLNVIDRSPIIIQWGVFSEIIFTYKKDTHLKAHHILIRLKTLINSKDILSSIIPIILYSYGDTDKMLDWRRLIKIFPFLIEEIKKALMSENDKIHSNAIKVIKQIDLNKINFLSTLRKVLLREEVYFELFAVLASLGEHIVNKEILQEIIYVGARKERIIDARGFAEGSMPLLYLLETLKKFPTETITCLPRNRTDSTV